MLKSLYPALNVKLFPIFNGLNAASGYCKYLIPVQEVCYQKVAGLAAVVLVALVALATRTEV